MQHNTTFFHPQEIEKNLMSAIRTFLTVKRLLVIALCLFVLSSIKAQEADSLSGNTEKQFNLKDLNPDAFNPGNTINSPSETLSSLNDSVQVIDSITDSLNNITSGTNGIRDSLQSLFQAGDPVLDSLQGLNSLIRIDNKRRAFLDSLSLFNLPANARQTVDSLRAIPDIQDQLSKKLNTDKITSADTLITKYSKAINELMQKNNLSDGSSLLPDTFHDQISNWKRIDQPNADIPMADDLDNWIQKQETSFTNLLNAESLDEKLSMDLNYLDKVKQKSNNLNGFLGKLNNPTEKYTSKLGGLNANIPDTGIDNPAENLPGLKNIKRLENIPTDDLNKLMADYNKMDQETLDDRIDQLAQKAEASKMLEKNTSQLTGDQTKFMSEAEKLNQYNNQKFARQQALKKSRLLVNDVIEENFEQVGTAFEEIRSYKNKYAKVNSNLDVEAGIEKPVRHIEGMKRFFFGGQLQLIPGDPLSLDFDPMAGYRLNTRLSVGIGGTFRYDLKSGEKYFPGMDKEPVYGFNGFAEYTFFKSIYLHGQVERMSIYNASGSKIWQTNYMAGIGKSVRIKKNLSMDVLILYHFNHKDNTTYNSPLQIKVGLSNR